MDFPQPQMIDVNGVSLEVFTAGQGTPLVLCHVGQNTLIPGVTKFNPW